MDKTVGPKAVAKMLSVNNSLRGFALEMVFVLCLILLPGMHSSPRDMSVESTESGPFQEIRSPCTLAAVLASAWFM
jgi:hypothetical protein